MLPDESLLTLKDRYPCRETPLRQLSALLSPTLSSPSTIVVYGLPSSGKSSIVSDYLQASTLNHAFVTSRECVTGRHLLEQTVASIHEHLFGPDRDPLTAFAGRCENLNALCIHLQSLLDGLKKFILVLDGVDQQREPPPTLMPALTRIGELVPSLTVVLIVRHPSARFLHRSGIPHVYFAPYSRSQVIHILSQNAPDIFDDHTPRDDDYNDEVHMEDKMWLWPRFCGAVWDSFAHSSAQDLVSFRSVCHDLWKPFVAPIIRGDFGTRDFSRLLVAQRRLFQDDGVLLESLVPAHNSTLTGNRAHDLPPNAKWLLVAAYLASFNPVKTDALHFMKATERKKRKRGGGGGRAPGRPSQRRKIPRHLLPPSAFSLDRLLSIFHAIIPDDIRSSIDMFTQVSSLTSLKLLSRGTGVGSNDPLEAGGKWRVSYAVTWDYVQALARSLDFGLIDYIAE